MVHKCREMKKDKEVKTHQNGGQQELQQDDIDDSLYDCSLFCLGPVTSVCMLWKLVLLQSSELSKWCPNYLVLLRTMYFSILQC